MKSQRRLAVLAALGGTVALAGWVATELAGPGSLVIESTGASIEVSRATSATARAEHVDAPQATALGGDGVSVANTGRGGAALSDPPPMPRPAAVPVGIALLNTPDPERNEAKEATGSVKVADTGRGGSALADPRPMPRPATPSVQIASFSAPDPVRSEAKEATGSVEVGEVGSGAALSEPRPMPLPATPPVQLAAVSPTDPVQSAARPSVSSEALDACPEPDACIDQYLWLLYERTPKVDTVKVEERIKVKVKNKTNGKTRTVVKTLTKYVTQNFAWKDPIAAQKAGMSLKDYVIGGMDRGFKRKLYSALRAMDEAGFSPGITSGFRDDYRQELVSGNKAASDSSYHGGSRRGGYGHGLAADLVSVKGETRAERYTWSDLLWKWIDAHEKELGIGRPYLDKDPPHVAPIDGNEYADKRSAAKARLAGVKRPSLSTNPK